MSSRGLVLAFILTLSIWVMSTGSAQCASSIAYLAHGIWVANADGSEARHLGSGYSPLISPDGRFVAWSLNSSPIGPERGPALALRSTDTPRLLRFFSLRRLNAQALAFSPDSRYLAVALRGTSIRHPLRQSGLVILDTTTGTTRKIATGEVHGASFAVDGSDRVSYGLARSQSYLAAVDIHIASADGRTQMQITHDASSLNPLWGPTGIVLDRERRRSSDAPIFQLWMLQADGSNSRQLTHLRVPSLLNGLVPVALSQDGLHLAAEYEGQDTSEAWAVDTVSGSARRLSFHGRPLTGWGISRDGTRVLVVNGALEQPPWSGTIATIPFSSGPLTVLIGHASLPSWNG